MADGVKVNVGLDASALNTGLAKMNSSFGALREQLKGITGLAGKMNVLNGAFDFIGKLTAPLSALKGQITSAFDVAGQAEQTRTSFKVLIGSVEETTAVLGQLKKLADTSPYGDQEINDAAKSLLAFGQSAGTVAQALTTIGDIASGVGAPIGEIAELYGKARVQGTLFAEDINQLTGRGINVLDSFAAQLGVGVEQVKKMGSEGKINFGMLEKAFADMTSKGGKFEGMMKAQSGTFNGLKSTLLAGWDAIKVEFATPIMDALKPMMEFAIEKLTGMKSAAKEVGESIAEWVTYIKGAFELGEGMAAIGLDLKIALFSAWDAFTDYVSNGANIGAKLAGGLHDAVGGLGKIVTGNIDKIGDGKKTIGDAIREEAARASENREKPEDSPRVKALKAQREAMKATVDEFQKQEKNLDSRSIYLSRGNKNSQPEKQIGMSYADKVAEEQRIAGQKDVAFSAMAAAQNSARDDAIKRNAEEFQAKQDLEKQLADSRAEIDAEVAQKKADKELEDAQKVKRSVEAVSDSITKIGGGGFVGSRVTTTEQKTLRTMEESKKINMEARDILKQIRDKNPTWQ